MFCEKSITRLRSEYMKECCISRISIVTDIRAVNKMRELKRKRDLCFFESYFVSVRQFIGCESVYLRHKIKNNNAFCLCGAKCNCSIDLDNTHLIITAFRSGDYTTFACLQWIWTTEAVLSGKRVPVIWSKQGLTRWPERTG